MKRIFPAPLVLLLVAGCTSYSPNKTTTAKKAEPVAAQAAKRDIVGFENIQGEVTVPPEDQAAVYASVVAPVEQVMATVGARVRKGEVIVQLSYPNAEAAYEGARSALQAAEAAYAQALSQYGAGVKAAEQQLAQARKDEQLARALTKEGAATDLPAATAARELAEEEVERARRDRDTQALPYKQQLESIRAEFEQAKVGAKMGSIRAPISGTVLAMNVKAGDQVNPKKPLATIVDLGNIHVLAPVTREQAEILKDKQKVSITFKDIPEQTFEGDLFKVSTFAAKPGSKEARLVAIVDFKNDEGLVKPDMKVAYVVVKTGEVKDVIAVPAGAVDRDASGKPVVKIKSGENWLVTLVEVGLTDGEYTQIKSGVKEGDTVLVTPEDTVT